jgi:hypothetical protein
MKLAKETGGHFKERVRSASFIAVTLALAFLAFTSHAAVPTLIYRTGFETNQGYASDFTLVNQDGWVGSVNGGNAVVSNYFPGQGQQAFIGYIPLAGGAGDLALWRPVNYAPLAAGLPVVRFTVTFQIVDSTNPARRDDFRWSVYNTNGVRLFTVDFDNLTGGICYALEDSAEFLPTAFTFVRNGVYDLEIVMNFARNRWGALVNGTEIVAGQPITTLGSGLHLGDVDAVWSITNPTTPGDNYMLFDDYQISAESPDAAAIEALTTHPDGRFGVEMRGEPGVRYALEATTDLKNWFSIQTNLSANGVVIFTETDAAAFNRQFYRTRLLGP